MNHSMVKKYSLELVILLVLFFICAHPAWAQEEPGGSEDAFASQDPAPEERLAPPSEPAEKLPPIGEVIPSEKGIDERISLDLRNIEVTEALRFLSMKGGLNMAVSKDVSGRLYLLLNNVTIRDIFDLIILSNALAYDKQGEIYNIMTETEYKERYGRKFSDVREVKIFDLKYAIPERVFTSIDALKSDIGRVLVDQESGMVLVMDTPTNLKRMEDAIETLERKREVQVFKLQYAKAKDVEEKLKTQLDAKGVGSVISDERSNQIVVQTFSNRMDAVAELVASLDQKTKEVLLVSKIVKVTLQDELDAEIQWEGLFKQVDLFPWDSNEESFLGNHARRALERTGQSFIDDFAQFAPAGTVTAPTARPTQGAKNTLTENVFLGQGGEDGWEVLIKFLRTIGKTKVLASPRITVINNQEAKIHVGDRQAYVTTTTTTGGENTTTAEAVTFIDVGIQLSVTPTINDDGFITMRIKPEISSKVDELETPSGNVIPIINTSEAETSVMVKDNTTVVIAGLRQDEYIEQSKRVPGLGDIPGIGKLFRSTPQKDKIHTELLVILTPHIVGGDRMVTGEPELPPGQTLKRYQSYSSLEVEPDHKPGSSSPISGFFNKFALRGND